MKHLEEAIRQAVKSIDAAGLEIESPAGQTALEVVLRYLLDQKDSDPRALIQPQAEASREGGEPVDRLAAWSGIAGDRLNDFFEFGDRGVGLIVPENLLPASRADRQRMLAHLKLAIDSVAYGQTELPARDIASLCRDYACLDDNLSKNLTVGYSNYVTRRGRRAGTHYRLTQPGREAARNILSDLAATDAS